MTPMAKKRKLTTKPSPATLRQQKIKKQQEEVELQQQQRQQLLEQQQQQQKQLQPVKEIPAPAEEPVPADAQEEEDDEDLEYEEVEEEDEEDEEEEVEEDEREESKHGNTSLSANQAAADEDDEPIQKLLEPFSKEQLINLLTQAAESHYDVAARIRQIADQDPVHRKIFVHGLGWDTTADTLRNAFCQYGEIEDCKAVTDKISGKSKGYGFILFKSRSGANKALKQPQKKIGNRMTACQLAAIGPVPANAGAVGTVPQQPQAEYTQRKIYVSNVSADIDPFKLTGFFAKFGEIEEGPLGLDKQTGKPKGFCLFVYKTAESAKRALEDPHKNFEGHMLHCQRAIDGPKPGKQQQIQQRNVNFGRNDNLNLGGNIGATAINGAAHLMGPSVGAVPFNQGATVAAQAALNPALGQALTALLASQGAGFGLTNLLGTIGTAGVGSAMNPAVPGGYGNQAVGTNGVLGGYGGQGLQAAYPSQQSGQGSAGRSQHGHMGGVTPYSGH
ncbi:hypothetical protein Dimus_002045 [Dionaea muscipula]